MSRVTNIADKVKMVVSDSLQNLLSGLGVNGMDKSTASQFVETKLTDRELEDAYSSDWLSGKVCDLPPFDMTREWRTMDGDMTPEDKAKWIEYEKLLKLPSKSKDAMTWGRVYGGAGIVINVKDGKEPWEPLDLNAIKKDSLQFLIVSDKQFLHLGTLDNNPFSENYGFPDTYRLAPSSVQIHHTRVIRFEGKPLPLQARRRNKYWGKSIIEALHSALQRAAEAQESVGTLLHESTVDVIRIPDLMAQLANPETTSALTSRFATAKLQKSINRMLLMDIDEEYEQHAQSFTGVVELIEKFLSIVGGAADIPITRLLGTSPAGMDATGESDIRNYYDFLSAKQETELRPKLEYLDQIMFRSLFGREPREDELSFEFNPLWQMSEAEKAELQANRAVRDQAYTDMNVVNEAIIAKDLSEKGVYSGVDAEYVKEMEKLVKEAEEEEGIEEPDMNAPDKGEGEGNATEQAEKEEASET